MTMSDRRLSSLIDEAERDSIFNSGNISDANRKLAEYYDGELFGDEEEGRSSVVVTDVADTIDADMTSLSRVFLGAGEVVEFQPINASPEAIHEAEEKNLYINWLIDNIPDSYKKQSDWLKEIDLFKVGYIEYGLREETKTETKQYFNINQDWLELTMADIEATRDVDKVDVVETSDDGETFDVTLKITRTKQVYFINNVANEDLIISRNSQTKNDADIFGKHFRKSRGDLVAEGFDKKIVMSLSSQGSNSESGGAKQERFKTQGGEDEDPGLNDTPNQIIEGMDVYVMVDFDGDGIPERRHVIKVGTTILLNDPFDHVPYAGCSAIQMPHNIIGKSRGELVLSHQRVNSVLTRNLLDNSYQVALGRTYVNEDIVDLDDFYSAHKTGVVRVDGDPRAGVMPEIVPDISTQTLQVIQYRDTQQAKTTGNLLTNQALSSDNLNQETATRFQGIQDAGSAKIELVARNIAEIGYKDLYDGLAWFASHYQNHEAEIIVLGKPLTVNPNQWKFDHRIKSMVGTGAGDDAKTLETLSGILAIQEQEEAKQSPLVDFQKKYNVLRKITKAAGLHGIDQYFNDPSKPDQLLQFENQQMSQQLQEAQQIIEQLSQNNPLAEAEAVKNEGKQMTDNKKLAIDAAKLQEDARQFDVSTAQKEEDRRVSTVVKFTEIEAETGQDVPGSAI